MSIRPQLIAIVGGSGSGKTWLAERLQEELGSAADRVSLDDFYRDRPYLSPLRRARLNFDHPRAIDWVLFQRVLDGCLAGLTVRMPTYDFTCHARAGRYRSWKPRAVVLIEGLWLLRRPPLRRLFDLRIFLDCEERLRFQRRLSRDVAQRGRTRRSVREQFYGTVAPMHDLYVQSQARWADIVLGGNSSGEQVKGVAERILGLEGVSGSGGNAAGGR